MAVMIMMTARPGSVRSQVLMMASMKMTAFWDILLCTLTEVDQHFRDAYCIRHQGTLMMAVCTSETSMRLQSTISQKAAIFNLW
jgi:hypothetical protein